MMKQTKTTFILLLFFYFAFTINIKAQEEFRPLTSNTALFHVQKPDRNGQFSYRSVRNLDQPFFDDFSYDLRYPVDSLWEDSLVFINNTMAILPISIGVATFDGLNEHGMPYNPGATSSTKICDKLTSVPIDLSSYNKADSIYLTFSYQPEGIGDRPEAGDSLVLEVKPDSFWNGAIWDKDKWYRIWSTAGGSLHNFKTIHINIPPKIISDSTFLGNLYHSNFQFRFMNYGNPAGNNDIWNLDYIQLAKGETQQIPYFKDLAVVYEPNSFLKDYQSMPWLHMIPNVSTVVQNKIEMTVRNLFDQTLKARGGYKLIDTFNQGQILYNDNANSQDITDLLNFPLTVHAAAEAKLGQVTTADAFALRFTVADFSTTTDEHPENNEASRWQVFDNYYAYDDGTPELGYGISNTKFAQVAYKFSLPADVPPSDSLRGVWIYFNQSIENTSSLPFTLLVWSDKDEDPLVEVEANIPLFDNSQDNGFYYYDLDTVLHPTDTFYIGWQQYSEFYMNVGVDLNYYRLLGDSTPVQTNKNVFYNTGAGWKASSTKGALMMRPVFSSKPVINSVRKSEPQSTLDIFPNPAGNYIYFHTVNKLLDVWLYDMNGKLVLQKKVTNKQLNIESLQTGIYLMQVRFNNNRSIENFKIIKQ